MMDQNIEDRSNDGASVNMMKSRNMYTGLISVIEEEDEALLTVEDMYN